MKSLFFSFSKYSVIGVFAALIHLVLALYLISLAWQPLLANVLAYILAAMFSFVGHYHITFVSSVSKSKAIARFMMIAVTMFFLNNGFLWFLLTFIISNAVLAVIVCNAVMALASFVVSKHWVFEDKR